MLILDDNLYRLARMQESLLKVGGDNTKEHLENYVKTVIQVDGKAFDELVKLMKDADKYNQTLEDELAYLEKIKTAYNQMVELQMKFKNVCERYGESNLELSDLSQLNIEYVDDRINAINGYLINVKNIEKNKNNLEKLNEQLVSEEKKREFLEKKILILEKKLKDSFVCITLKQVVFGKLENFDIKNEYENLGYDLVDLLDSADLLENKINSVNNQFNEINEKYQIAKVCHNNLFNGDSTKIMNDIEKEFYNVKYKLVMLNMIKLLSEETDRYELAMSKRDKFIGLVKDRSECLEKLGMRNPLNILHFVDMQGQLDEINLLSENIKNIHNIRKDISDTTLKTEEMINQNNDYLISLSETKEMIKSKVSLNDFDITTFDDIMSEEAVEKKIILNNQVVKVRRLPSNFKLNMAKQKARGVVERICKLNAVKSKTNVVKEVYTPNLVIGPKKETASHKIEEISEVTKQNDDIFMSDNIEVLDLVDISVSLDELEEPLKDGKENINVFEEINPEEPVFVALESKTEEKVEVPSVNNDIFEVTTPFEEPVLFSDKSDNETSELVIKSENKLSSAQSEIMQHAEVELPTLDKIVSEQVVLEDDAMPDAFWVTDEVVLNNNDEERKELSFEEQINALLSDSSDETVSRKR